MRRIRDRFEYYRKGRRPGEREPRPGTGSQGAADIGARGSASGGRYAEDEKEREKKP